MPMHLRYGVQTIRGFSAIELLVGIAIMASLALIGVINYMDSREQAHVRALTTTLVFHLEETRTAAIAGKGGDVHGVHFDTDAYTVFSGLVYDADDVENIQYPIEEGFVLSTDMPDDVVIFSRITGAVSNPGTVTIMSAGDETVYREIVIGPRGDISIESN